MTPAVLNGFAVVRWLTGAILRHMSGRTPWAPRQYQMGDEARFV
ncbi:hypothetical protein J3E64_002952 [Sphingobium sp. OAS761]|nr:hypothetical protein [Sphingobium sp. OAS761]MCP1471248.1 hypothetical protein [Sphingobium sp. OAS761]